MGRSFFIILVWLISIIIAVSWGYENPEKVEIIKSYFKKNKAPKTATDSTKTSQIIANAFNVGLSKVISLSEKTSFILSDTNFSEFNENAIQIYTQNGYIVKKAQAKKLNLPNSFTLQRNGGIKTVFFNKNKSYALISSVNKECFYASIVSLENSSELFSLFCFFVCGNRFGYYSIWSK